jgi:acetyl/propionyl-CoA carboxylase alpha subunit
VRELNFRSVPDVWGYFSVDSTGRVHEFADSQIGHLFAWGSDREEARRKMVMVLKEVSIRGDIHTTVEYLADLLQTSDYKRNAISTQWLDKRISANVVPAKPNSLLVAVLGAVWTAQGALSARRRAYLDCVERGQLPSEELLSLSTPAELIYDDTKFNFKVCATGPSTLDVECNSSSVDVHVRQLSDGGMLVVVGGKSHVVYGASESAGLRLMIDGATCMFTHEYDPTVIRAAQTGKLAKCSVPDGTHLRKGDTFAQVEVMKMFLPLVVPEAGVVTFAKAEGTVLAAGDLIARLALDDSTTVHKSSDFTGQLPQSWPHCSFRPLRGWQPALPAFHHHQLDLAPSA